MKFNKIPFVAAAILGAAVPHLANAADCVLTPSGAVGGAPTGTARVNFDNLTAGTPGAPAPGGVATGPSGTVTVTRTGNGGVVSGEAFVSAAPFLSGNNGTGFGPGGTLQANGDDATPYLTSGSAGPANTVTLQFPGPQMYLGLLWGSVDACNMLTFYNGATLVGTVTGAQVKAGANGDQGVQGTLYVNINSTCAFDRVVASSCVTSFEFDNVAYNATPINCACVYTQGYWKNHAENWPRSSLSLGTNNYSKAQLLEILHTPVKGNGLISLAHQLIAAKLNLAQRGACAAPAAVATAITAADAIIAGALIPPTNGSKANVSTSTVSSLVEILDAYNNGKAPGGPTHCDDEDDKKDKGNNGFGNGGQDGSPNGKQDDTR